MKDFDTNYPWFQRALLILTIIPIHAEMFVLSFNQVKVHMLHTFELNCQAERGPPEPEALYELTNPNYACFPFQVKVQNYCEN